MVTTMSNTPAADQNNHIKDPRLARLISLWTVSEETQDSLQSCRTYEEYEDVVSRCALSCSSHTTDSFHRFYGMQRFIPAGILVKLALEVIYPMCRVDRGMFFELLAKALVKESPAEKAEREEYVYDRLKDHIKLNGRVTLYRGATSLNYKPTSAISYTLSREKAEWFKNRNQLFGGTDGVVIEKDFPLSKILWYTDCRKEQEVIVESPYLRRLINQAMISNNRPLREEKKLVC
ncbi:MAG: hypothetical protein Q4D04_15635 [Clostridia bacterium]|nr:hypothetical protein [Clostridia bacterium]